MGLSTGADGVAVKFLRCVAVLAIVLPILYWPQERKSTMNPVWKALSGAAVRWLMVFAGAHGVELGSEQAETIVNAALIVVPLLWSAYQKWRTHETIKDAKAGLL